ncbi:MAG TPA: hypothetical protein VKG64_14140 [Methylomirabilota bacterium]|nr:hypothetical protein [Methylomirabilota bacterium]
MNPILQWLVVHTLGRREARRCPKCGRRRRVRWRHRGRSVGCRRCGTLLPPVRARA